MSVRLENSPRGLGEGWAPGARSSEGDPEPDSGSWQCPAVGAAGRIAGRDRVGDHGRRTWASDQCEGALARCIPDRAIFCIISRSPEPDRSYGIGKRTVATGLIEPAGVAKSGTVGGSEGLEGRFEPGRNKLGHTRDSLGVVSELHGRQFGMVQILRRINAEISAEPIPFDCERIVDSGFGQLITMEK